MGSRPGPQVATTTRRRRTSALLPCLILAFVGACDRTNSATEPATTQLAPTPTQPPLVAPAITPELASPPLVAAAWSVRYDPTYVRIAYPGGDVAPDRGVCTDVVIRAFRSGGLDLQRAVHEDMRAHFRLYPQLWGATATDRNIDHRRVPNLRRWFERQGWEKPVTSEEGKYMAGDIVTWQLSTGVPHIGIVSDRRTRDGRPLVLHNIGQGTREEDALFAHALTGHYRPQTQYAQASVPDPQTR